MHSFLTSSLAHSLVHPFSLDHSIANMFIIPFGMMNGAAISMKEFLIGSILPVTLGNIVGGAVCVAALYTYSFSNKFKM